jgi:glycosyltransferase involved in cell wall biosynthesis
MNDISIVIKTFERQKALERLLDSVLQQGYGECPILIADDSRTPYKEAICAKYGDAIDTYITLPFDSGLSKGRNELLKRVETKYFVLNDDDFVYDDRTRLEWMHHQLETADLDLLGGVVYEPRLTATLHFDLKHPRRILRSLYHALRSSYKQILGDTEVTKRFYGDISVSDGTVYLKHATNRVASPFARCDFTLNFFMARTASIRDKVGGWHDRLKLQEHWEFFYRAKKNGLKIAHTDHCGVQHLRESDENYDTYRNRHDKYRRLSLDIHGFQHLQIGSSVSIGAQSDNGLQMQKD